MTLAWVGMVVFHPDLCGLQILLCFVEDEALYGVAVVGVLLGELDELGAVGGEEEAVRGVDGESVDDFEELEVVALPGGGDLRLSDGATGIGRRDRDFVPLAVGGELHGVG